MRLNRYLAAAGFGSRRSCETLIEEGKVEINGALVTDLATQVQPRDRVYVDGKLCSAEPSVFILLNKPAGYLCSREPQGDKKTVFDLLPENIPRVFYVGRLDADTTGLLLMTNDGEFAHRLAHPSHRIEKIYEAGLDREFDIELGVKMKRGFRIPSGFAKVNAIYKLAPRKVKVVLGQGLNRQIRLMFKHLGYRVQTLKRVQYGNLRLGHLRSGEMRFVGEPEMKRLFPEAMRKQK